MIDAEVLQILEDMRSSATPDFREARSLPPGAHTSEAFFEFEKEAIWARTWLCLGRVDQIPERGDYLSVRILDEPYLVTRAFDGEIYAMSAVCRHKGNTVVTGSGRCDSALQCPYHAWTYNLDGRLIGAPEMRSTISLEDLKEETRLPQLQVEIWQGYIFANADPQAAPLAPQLAKLEAVIEPYRLGEMLTAPSIDIEDMPWSWKILQDNFLEPYHTTYLHRGVHDFAPGRLTEFAHYEDGDGQIMRHTGLLEIDGSLIDTGWGKPSLFPIIETLDAVDRQRITWATIPPMMFIGFLPDMVLSYSMLPTGIDSMTLRINFCFPPDRFEIPDLEERCQRVLSGSKTVVEQDVAVNTAVQQNMRSRFAPRGRIAEPEQISTQLNRWLYRQYRSYADELLAKQGP